jgi:hypothetical protein
MNVRTISIAHSEYALACCMLVLDRSTNQRPKLGKAGELDCINRQCALACKSSLLLKPSAQGKAWDGVQGSPRAAGLASALAKVDPVADTFIEHLQVRLLGEAIIRLIIPRALGSLDWTLRR